MLKVKLLKLSFSRSFQRLNSLTSEVQEPKENPIQFLVHTIGIRQKVFFASERAKAGFQYNPELIQTQFLQTVMTGLQDDVISGDLKPSLQDPNVKDETLLEKMNTVYSLEMEKNIKMSALLKSKEAKVVAVQQEEKNCTEQVSGLRKGNGHAPKRITLIEKLKAGNKAICDTLQYLTTEVASLSQTNRTKIGKYHSSNVQNNIL
jgi:hypothetical protein